MVFSLPHLNLERTEAQEVLKLRLLQGQIQRFLAAQEANCCLWGKRLHNEIGQLLSVLCMQLQQTEDRGSAGDASNFPLKLAQQALQAVREMSLDLEPSVWEGMKLPEVLRCYLLSRFQSPERTVEVRAPCSWNWNPLAPEIETACLRIVQEVVFRWEEQVMIDHLYVALRQDAEAVWMTIRVQGNGFPAREDRSLREPCEPGWSAAQARVELLGGRWEPESSPANARAIRICLPLSIHPADPAGPMGIETS